MVGKIQVSYSEIIKNQKLTLGKLEDAYKHLSTGKSISRPGDKVVHFEVASALSRESFYDKAILQSLQSRTAWFQSIQEDFSLVQRILDDMLRLSSQSADPTTSPGDRDVFDVNFQESKKLLSQVIDGESGRRGAGASFASMPLLMGNFVPLDLSGQSSADDSPWSVNLFTNYAPPGESNLKVLEGDATFKSQTRVQLPKTASEVANYYVGAEVSILSGAGKDQMATIASYDAVTKIATLSSTLNEALNGSDGDQSHFEIDLAGRFASDVWGADNRYFNLNPDDPKLFIPITQVEINYREEEGISNTDLKAYTDEEVLARRNLNIFDANFGNVSSVENARHMLEQVSNSKEHLALFATKVASKLGRLQEQVSLTSSMKKWKDEGVGILEDANLAKSMTDIQELTTAHQKILELSIRLSESYGMLNNLIHNRGVR